MQNWSLLSTYQSVRDYICLRLLLQQQVFAAVSPRARQTSCLAAESPRSLIWIHSSPTDAADYHLRSVVPAVAWLQTCCVYVCVSNMTHPPCKAKCETVSKQHSQTAELFLFTGMYGALKTGCEAISCSTQCGCCFIMYFLTAHRPR